MSGGSHWALYGTRAIQRAYCSSCETWAFVLDGLIQCCDRPFVNEPTKIKRISEPEPRRKRPGVRDRQQILEEQGNVCLYCGRQFGSEVLRKGRFVVLRLTWDHLCPWKYSQNNRPVNFVAACSLCNSFKSDFLFNTIDEVREHVAKKWAEMEVPAAELRRVPERLLAETILAKGVQR